MITPEPREYSAGGMKEVPTVMNADAVCLGCHNMKSSGDLEECNLRGAEVKSLIGLN